MRETFRELLERAFSTPDLARCVVGVVHRRGNVERVVVRPLACYYLHKHSLIDPFGTQIPLHRMACLSCPGASYGSCEEGAECEALEGEWAWLVVCPCDSGKAVRGPPGYDPVYALRGPPYPLVAGGRTVACIPEGECDGELVKRGYWYWCY